MDKNCLPVLSPTAPDFPQQEAAACAAPAAISSTPLACTPCQENFVESHACTTPSAHDAPAPFTRRQQRAQEKAQRRAARNTPLAKQLRKAHRMEKRLAAGRATLLAIFLGGLAALAFFISCIVLFTDNLQYYLDTWL